MKRIWLFAIAVGVLTFIQSRARADDVVTDYDRRAAAAILSSYANKELEPSAMTATDLKGMTLWDNKTPGQYKYAMNFGGVTGGVDTKGTYRISQGATLTPIDPKKWQLLSAPKTNGPDVVYRKTTETDADRFIEVGVRQKLGGQLFTVIQRHPVTQDPNAAAAETLKRFTAFMENAKRCKLFGGEIALILTSDPDQPKLSPDEPLVFSLKDNAETTLKIRIEPRDPDDKLRTDVKELHIQLTGTLARFATVSVGGNSVEAVKRKCVVQDPDTAQELTIVLPAGNTTAVSDVLYKHTAAELGAPAADDGGAGTPVGDAAREFGPAAAKEPLLSLSVGVVFKTDSKQ
jgi:hypothetical protein